MRLYGSREPKLGLPDVTGLDANNPLLVHVDGQIHWYDQNAIRARHWHFRLRGLQVVLAALIPVTQIVPTSIGWRITAGILAGLVAVCQGFEGMHHYGEHYVAWRATCQSLLRERQLFAAGAGPYAAFPRGSRESLRLLAERVDAAEGQEQQRWADGQLKAAAPRGENTGS
jgi:Protein of unknown function (DUF4231)